jgi:hypothetical protein
MKALKRLSAVVVTLPTHTVARDPWAAELFQPKKFQERLSISPSSLDLTVEAQGTEP